MIPKPNISDFEVKRARIKEILQKRNVPCTESQIVKFLNPHEIVMAEIKVVLNYLTKIGEIDSKSTDSVNKTKLYSVSI
jgi:hypothetical protein